MRGCPFLDAAAEFPDPDSAAHAYARAQKLLMLRLVTDLVTELGVAEPELLADGAATLDDHAERKPTQ